MIRFRTNHARRGVSLTELAFALLVIGAVLGALWLKVGAVYQNYDITQAERELSLLAQTVRQNHLSGKVPENVPMENLNPPADLVGHYKGQMLVFNPWRGRVSVFRGNALGLGADSVDDEFTIHFDGVPQSACAPLVARMNSPQMRGLGLMAMYVAAAPGQGREFCFEEDYYCKTPVPSPSEGLVNYACKAPGRVTMMFTYHTH